MSEVKQKCQLEGCNRAASTRCFCCNKNVCTRHFTEHIDAVKAQIDPLANDINKMVEKIQGLTIEQITEASFAELHQWRIDMHQLVDEIFLAKTKEVEDLVETNKNKFVEHKKQQSETIMKIQDDVRQLAEDGDATFEQIQVLKNQLASVETNLTCFRKDFLSINARVFAQGLVTVSSNLNKQPAPPPPRNSKSTRKTAPAFSSAGTPTSAQSGSVFGTSPTTFVGSNVATPAQQPPGFSFSPFGSGLQNSPSTHPSLAPFGGFGTTSSTSFGGQAASPSVGSNNNQSAFGGSPRFQFSNNQPK